MGCAAKEVSRFPVGRCRIPSGIMQITLSEKRAPGAQFRYTENEARYSTASCQPPAFYWTSQRRPQLPAILWFHVATLLSPLEKYISGFKYNAFQYMASVVELRVVSVWRLRIHYCYTQLCAWSRDSVSSLDHSCLLSTCVPQAIAWTDFLVWVSAPDCPPVSTPPNILVPIQDWNTVLHSKCVTRCRAALLCSCPTTLGHSTSNTHYTLDVPSAAQ